VYRPERSVIFTFVGSSLIVAVESGGIPNGGCTCQKWQLPLVVCQQSPGLSPFLQRLKLETQSCLKRGNKSPDSGAAPQDVSSPNSLLAPQDDEAREAAGVGEPSSPPQDVDEGLDEASPLDDDEEEAVFPLPQEEEPACALDWLDGHRPAVSLLSGPPHTSLLGGGGPSPPGEDDGLVDGLPDEPASVFSDPPPHDCLLEGSPLEVEFCLPGDDGEAA
jgi:hypothetical protein